jgi:hypothetical protein
VLMTILFCTTNNALPAPAFGPAVNAKALSGVDPFSWRPYYFVKGGIHDAENTQTVSGGVSPAHG